MCMSVAPAAWQTRVPDGMIMTAAVRREEGEASVIRLDSISRHQRHSVLPGPDAYADSDGVTEFRDLSESAVTISERALDVWQRRLARRPP